MERMKTVSLCMIVKDEEKYLERCLNSVKDLVDEMIIVDTGSKDRTLSIAEKFGAIVKHYAWDDHFSNAKNYSLQFATKHWILLMDGDDEFCSEDKEKFIDLINNSQKDGHYFKTLSFAGEKPGRDTVSNLNLRLLRNNQRYKFVGAIHEQIARVDEKIDYHNFSTENIRVFHYGYLNQVAVEKNKRKRNIAIIEKELKEDPGNKFHLFNLGNEYYAMREKEKALSLYNEAYNHLDFHVGFAPKLVIRRIMCLEELGRHGEALAEIEKGMTYFPNFTDLEFIRGWIHFTDRRYTLAIDSFKRCLELGEPPIQLEFLNGAGTFRPYQALGEIYYKFEDYEKALICFENSLKLNPNSRYILYRIAKIFNRMYEEKKFVSYKIAQYFHLHHGPSLLCIADILMQEGLYDLAQGYLEKAGEMVEDHHEINFIMGKNLFYQKRFDEALERLERVGANHPQYGESLKKKFMIHLIQNDREVSAVLAKLKEIGDDFSYRVCLQLYSIDQGENKAILSEEDDPAQCLGLTMEILEDLLKVRAFVLFEKLLNVLNYIHSDQVLLELAKLYYNHGFKGMAAREVLRSIQELSAIDRTGVEILYDGYQG